MPPRRLTFRKCKRVLIRACLIMVISSLIFIRYRNRKFFEITRRHIFAAQSMSRAAAGFFAPYHGMWGFNSGSSSGKYLASGASNNATSNASNNFGYPPTPPKDSGTPDQQINEDNNGYGHHMNNNNLVSNAASVSSAVETKPTTEHLMNSISSLSAYAGLPSSSSKRLPEGTSSSQQYSSAAATADSMFYYPTSSDLAMYGSSSYGNRTLQSSRPKSKNRSNAGKKRVKD